MVTEEKQIFIWVSYGNAKAYLLETPEDWEILYTNIRNLFEEWEDTEVLKAGDRVLGISKSYKKSIEKMLREFGMDTAEMFEYGTGFSKLLKPKLEPKDEF